MLVRNWRDLGRLNHFPVEHRARLLLLVPLCSQAPRLSGSSTDFRVGISIWQSYQFQVTFASISGEGLLKVKSYLMSLQSENSWHL